VSEKPFRFPVIAGSLHYQIKDIGILIDYTPEFVALALNGDKEFVDVPRVAYPPLAFLELAGMVRSNLPAPITKGFIWEGDTTSGQQLFNLTETQTKVVVQPDGRADDLRGKTVTWVVVLLSLHAAQSAISEVK